MPSRHTRPLSPAHGFRAAIASLMVLAFIGAVPSAAAASELEVASVQGRDVELILSLDPSAAVDPTASARATVEINGAVIPARVEVQARADRGPRTALLLLDTSGSMAGARMTAARKAAIGFVETLPGDVAVGLITFGDAVDVVVDPTVDRAAVRTAITRVRATGDTALYDAVSAALDRAPDGARILVLSDGEDTVSQTGLTTVEALAEAGSTPVDVVALAPSGDQLGVLQGIVRASGGELRSAETAGQLAEAFIAATRSFGDRVIIRASVPPQVEASGQGVTATVGLGDAVFEATTRLPVSGSLEAVSSTSASSASATEAVGGSSPASVVLPLSLAVLIALCIVTIAVVSVRARQQRHVVERVEQVLRYRTSASHTSRAIVRELAERPAEPSALDRLVARLPGAAKTRESLAAAEFPLTLTTWLLARVGAAALAALLLSLLMQQFLAGSLIGITLVWLIAWLLLRSRARSRQQAFANSLPDFLMVLASGLRSGLSFTNGIQSAADEDTGEVGRQMRRALREVQVGSTLDDALMSCAERMDNDDLRWTVTALTIQREVGGNLSSILDTAAATIKSRDELRREVRTLSAEGRLSAYILVALPVGVFVFLLIFRRPYISLLWTDPLGIALLIGLGLAMVAGWFWMRSIVRIRV